MMRPHRAAGRGKSQQASLVPVCMWLHMSTAGTLPIATPLITRRRCTAPVHVTLLAALALYLQGAGRLRVSRAAPPALQAIRAGAAARAARGRAPACPSRSACTPATAACGSSRSPAPRSPARATRQSAAPCAPPALGTCAHSSHCAAPAALASTAPVFCQLLQPHALI